jgi:hypothetical protein
LVGYTTFLAVALEYAALALASGGAAGAFRACCSR